MPIVYELLGCILGASDTCSIREELITVAYF